MQRLIQSTLLFGGLYLLLVSIGHSWDSWVFWSFVGLFWATNRISWEDGALEGIIRYKRLSDQERHRLDSILKKLDDDNE